MPAFDELNKFKNPLFLVACSGLKQPGGQNQPWPVPESIGPLLTAPLFDDLLQARQNVYGQVLNDNRLTPRQIEINAGISNAHDLNGTVANASYLSARTRYQGFFYRVPGVTDVINDLARNNSILIISALYGLLRPCEFIQNYNFPINRPYAQNTWVDIVPRLIAHIVTTCKHDSIVALLAGAYLNVIQAVPAYVAPIPCFRVVVNEYPGGNAFGVCSGLGHAMMHIVRGVPIPADYDCQLVNL